MSIKMEVAGFQFHSGSIKSKGLELIKRNGRGVSIP